MPQDPYVEYVARFDALIGPLAVGGYGKWKGQLVRKLGPEEFAKRYGEYSNLHRHYHQSLERGDTLNDALTKMVRERAAELLLEEE